MKTLIRLSLFLSFTLATISSEASISITVAADGSGNFRTISAAIASLPDFNYERTIIFIKNGVYNENISICQDYITLQGESRENTIIRNNQPGGTWSALRDSVMPAGISIYGDDVILDNLTIENTRSLPGIAAPSILSKGTRNIFQNCNITSNGARVVSLLNYKTGMYYLLNCRISGTSDLLYTRGWNFIRNCSFFTTTKSSAIWAAGEFDKDQKLVIRNSTFNGRRGFELGHRQYDAQFFLLYCVFTDSLANKPISRIENNDTKIDKPNLWGDRYYFFECHGEHVDYDWHKNNLDQAQKRLRPEDMTSSWTFDGKWDPESKEGPKVMESVIKENTLLLSFSEVITLKGLPTIKSKTNRTLFYDSGAGTNTIRFKSDVKLYKEDVKGLRFVNDGRFISSNASVPERVADLTIGGLLAP